ncbi:MAG TPA: hypothetical protein DCR93_01610 [Cytophagales bacterium]|nr:hypothetical protein [Cytophagales bacterium]HAP58249.1 hypothetical protein [Cytophagales bacterium]
MILASSSATGQGRVFQEDLFGNWLVVSSERKDGSTVIEYEGAGLTIPLRWYVTRKEICNYKFPWGKSGCAQYSMYEDSRRLSLETGQQYDIDYLHGDTLVVSQIDLEKTDDQLTRFLLVRNGVWEPEVPPTAMEDAVYFEQYGPVINDAHILNLLYRLRDSGRAEYKVVIDFEKRAVAAEQLQSSFSDPDSERRLQIFLKRSYKDWAFHAKDRYPRVVQYLTVQVNLPGPAPTRIWYNSWDQIAELGHKAEVLIEAYQSFEQGLAQFNQNQLDSAVASFSKAYRLDPVMIAAVYNRALVYVRQGDMEKACEDWQHLAQRGQIAARDRWRETCR